MHEMKRTAGILGDVKGVNVQQWEEQASLGI